METTIVYWGYLDRLASHPEDLGEPWSYLEGRASSSE